ncbi:MAG: DUF1616 domain-containing protein, partial [Candidatus Hydrothermarchaeaceae archaeon]
WLSLAFIFAFFIFSFITSGNVLLLFIKRATALIFAFLIPGYVITRAVYPREIDAIERFAFSVAFSVSFVMLVSYVLNYVWAITPFSLALTTFSLALAFAFIAALRGYRTCGQPDSKEKESIRGWVIPLALIGLLFFLIKIYAPLADPRAGFVDTYLFSTYTQEIISKGAEVNTIHPFSMGYVPGYFFITAFLTFFLDTGVYEIMRYAHVFSFLSAVPAYLFARHVFGSRRIALLAVTFMLSTRWMFMRTSISNAESMSHFFVILFLLMLLKTIEKPTVKNCLVASLLLTSTVLEYHMTLQFLVPFIIVIFVFLGVRRLFTKTDPDIKNIIKTASLTVVPAVLVSGVLWFFWNLDRFFYGRPAADYLTKGLATDLIIGKNTFLGLAYHVRHIGLFEVVFLCAGVILVALHIKQRRNIRYQFLLVYFVVLLFLIQSRFFGIKALHTWYLFSWLTFPASMLAGYGFFNGMKAVRGGLIKTDINIPAPKILLVPAIVLILLVNFNGFNYHWYNHEASGAYLFDERVFLDPGTYLILQEIVDENGFLSSYLYRDYYGFYHPLSITLPEYEAFKEIKERTPPDSLILLWGCKKAYMWGISERSALPLEDMGIEPDYDSPEILRKNIEHEFDKGLFYTDGSVVKYNTSTNWASVHYDFPGGLDTGRYRFFEMRYRVDKGGLYVGAYDSNLERHEFIYSHSTDGKWETYKLDLYWWLKVRGHDTTIYGITLNGDLGSDISFNSTIDWIGIHDGAGIGFREDFMDTTYWRTYLDDKFASADRFMVAGLSGEFPYGTCPTFSNETLASLHRDPNFRPIYQNEQIKIYKLTRDYTAFLDRPIGFREGFADLFYWGNDLSERAVLRTDGDIATYQALNDDQPIDVDFSTGLDTRAYPYFEARMRVDSGRISIAVYDSAGREHMFLKDYTTNGSWETYKFNLNEWLVRKGYDTDIYGIRITGALEDDAFFSANFDWLNIHNHIFWDMFEDESKIANTDNVVLDNGGVTLSKTKTAIEILSNGGFENGSEGWHLGAGWSLDSEEAHSGSRSAVLRGTVDPAGNDPSTLLDTTIYRGILKPATAYRLAAWVKGDVSDAVRGVVRQFGSAEPWSEWIHFTEDNKYGNWTYAEGIVTTPGDVNGDFYIRIYGGGNPAVWIDDISFGEEVYESSGTLTSTVTTTDSPIVSVTPRWTSTEPDGTGIVVEVSVDNGTTWKEAENGVPISYAFNDSNKHLLYRAHFQTDDVHKSPTFDDITLIYEEIKKNSKTKK